MSNWFILLFLAIAVAIVVWVSPEHTQRKANLVEAQCFPGGEFGVVRLRVLDKSWCREGTCFLFYPDGRKIETTVPCAILPGEEGKQKEQ